MPVSFSRLRRTTLACLALASSALAAPALYAADWPTKPIQLVIPYPPGGSADLLARPLAAQLQQQMGQSVILEYKPARVAPWHRSTWPVPSPMATRC